MESNNAGKCTHVFIRLPKALTFLSAILLAVAVIAPNAAWGAGSFTGVINLNTATQQELEQLPGVGPSKAGLILEYRRRRPFRTVAELIRVKGFGVKSVQRLRPHLSVTAATQLVSDAATNKQDEPCACVPAVETSPADQEKVDSMAKRPRPSTQAAAVEKTSVPNANKSRGL